MITYMRVLFILATIIELTALGLWLSAYETKPLGLFLVIISMLLLQVNLLMNSKYKLWSRTDFDEKQKP